MAQFKGGLHSEGLQTTLKASSLKVSDISQIKPQGLAAPSLPRFIPSYIRSSITAL
jgi:hypothetical protein